MEESTPQSCNNDKSFEIRTGGQGTLRPCCLGLFRIRILPPSPRSLQVKQPHSKRPRSLCTTGATRIKIYKRWSCAELVLHYEENPVNRVMERLLEWRPLFRQMAPLQQLLDSIRTSPGWPSLEIQEQLYASLFNDEVTESFPVDPSYRSKLIHSVCKEIEDACEEVYEPLLREWNAIPYDSPALFTGDAGCYVTYEIDSNTETLLLHLRVAPKHNEVGLRLWEAGFMLAEYILSAAELTQARQVVEVGAGVGLVGLLAACCCEGVDSVVMTDGDPAVLKYLRHNVEVNMASYSSKVPVSVQHVDWTDLSTLEPLLAQHPRCPRLVLGADVIYDPAQVPALTCAIRELLLASAGNHADADARDNISQGGLESSTLSGASDHVGDAIAIIACTLRNPETYKFFLRHIEAAGLACEDATIEARRKIAESLRAGSPFYYDKGAVRIHKISLPRRASVDKSDDHEAGNQEHD